MAVKTKSCCFPHAGGDVSVKRSSTCSSTTFSPRRWGCFSSNVHTDDRDRVFPTQVGMFLATPGRASLIPSFPHAGGDVSVKAVAGGNSPIVFPTQVGMFPMLEHERRTLKGFPHAGGDVSVEAWATAFWLRFSPRRWGCFQGNIFDDPRYQVFPTQVGMFPWL